MKIPNLWGQGQLFAFSGLDGKTNVRESFSGNLSGDRIGIRFGLKKKRELAIVGFKSPDLKFNAVCGDYICADTKNGKIKIIFYNAHTIIGEITENLTAVVFTEGRFIREVVGNIAIQNTDDGDYTAICTEGTRFAFAYSKVKEEALRFIKDGLKADITKEEEKKKAYFEKYSNAKRNEALYAKCLSVMKTQLYSDDNFKTIWSTPDRLPHKHIWLWDSVFHAVGFRNLDGKLAEDLMLAMLEMQEEDGKIPCLTRFDSDGKNYPSHETQPPVIAWGAWKVYQKSRNKDFLKKIYDANSRFLKWCSENRKYSKGLYAWWVNESDPKCRCGESGMDNSPRFDDTKHLLAVDFSCFVANELRYMAKIASELGLDCSEFEIEYEDLKKAINDVLWCEKDGYYFDYDADRDRINPVKTVVSFLPLFAGVCEKENAKRLISHLTNPDEFYTEFPIPSVSKDDPTYGTDMWRGPVWINYNYMICEGLREYGYNKLAKEIMEKTISVVEEWYIKDGVIYEFYDSENVKSPSSLNRKGEVTPPFDMSIKIGAIRDYGWSACLALDIMKDNQN